MACSVGSDHCKLHEMLEIWPVYKGASNRKGVSLPVPMYYYLCYTRPLVKSERDLQQLCC